MTSTTSSRPPSRSTTPPSHATASPAPGDHAITRGTMGTVLAAGRVDVADRLDAPLLHRALRPPIARVLHRWFGLTIEGIEHVPTHGPCIIAANHHNYLDGVVLSVAVPARCFTNGVGDTVREARQNVTARVMADIAGLLP